VNNNDNKQTRDLPNVISSDTPRFLQLIVEEEHVEERKMLGLIELLTFFFVYSVKEKKSEKSEKKGKSFF